MALRNRRVSPVGQAAGELQNRARKTESPPTVVTQLLVPSPPSAKLAKARALTAATAVPSSFVKLVTTVAA